MDTALNVLLVPSPTLMDQEYANNAQKDLFQKTKAVRIVTLALKKIGYRMKTKQNVSKLHTYTISQMELCMILLEWIGHL